MNATMKPKSTTRSFRGCGLVCPAAVTTLLLCLTALLIAGCQTPGQRVEERISQKSAFFAALPNESQQRIRKGVVNLGDAREAVWIVFGKPDRVFQKVSGTSTNEVWSYVTQNSVYCDDPNRAYYPANTSRGRTLWRPDSFWNTHTHFDTYEYLRIQFDGNRVSAIEAQQP